MKTRSIYLAVLLAFVLGFKSVKATDPYDPVEACVQSHAGDEEPYPGQTWNDVCQRLYGEPTETPVPVNFPPPPPPSQPGPLADNDNGSPDVADVAVNDDTGGAPDMGDVAIDEPTWDTTEPAETSEPSIDDIVIIDEPTWDSGEITDDTQPI